MQCSILSEVQEGAPHPTRREIECGALHSVLEELEDCALHPTQREVDIGVLHSTPEKAD